MLFVGVHARQIPGWPTAESRMYLNELLEHATQRENVYVHEWERGDLVIWDNRSTLHRVGATTSPNAANCAAPPSTTRPKRC